MSASDDIADIVAAEGLDPQQKSERIAAIRAAACYDALVGGSFPFPAGGDSAYIIVNGVVQTNADGTVRASDQQYVAASVLRPGLVNVWVSAYTASGSEISIDPHHVVVNPPLTIIGTDDVMTVAPARALMDAIVRVVESRLP